MKILVVGATGFVGRSLVDQLNKEGFTVFSAVRKNSSFSSANVRFLGDLEADEISPSALDDIDVVVHLAGRVHILNDTSSNPLEAFRKVNVLGTGKLLQACIRAKVKRFVYLSTIKVNGEYTENALGFSEEDKPNPQDDYARSKYEAEELIRDFCKFNSIEWVIIRPPLIYGADVKANFRSLFKILKYGVPLPLGKMSNRRSLISLDNLNQIIIKCIDSPKAVNELFLVSDNEVLSLTKIIFLIREGVGSSSFLLPVPRRFLEIILISLGYKSLARKICSELVVDNNKMRRVFSEVSLIPAAQALSSVANSWQEKNK